MLWGARIRVVGGGIARIREIAGGGSYLSQSDLRAHFGMGKAGRAETVEVKWPSGEQQTFHKCGNQQVLRGQGR